MEWIIFEKLSLKIYRSIFIFIFSHFCKMLPQVIVQLIFSFCPIPKWVLLGHCSKILNVTAKKLLKAFSDPSWVNQIEICTISTFVQSIKSPWVKADMKRNMFDKMIEFGRLDLLKSIYDNHPKWLARTTSGDLVSKALACKKIDIAAYLWERGAPKTYNPGRYYTIDTNVYWINCNPDVADFLHRYGIPWSINHWDIVVRKENVEMVQWFLKNWYVTHSDVRRAFFTTKPHSSTRQILQDWLKVHVWNGNDRNR